MKNLGYGLWSEEETNWSEKDTQRTLVALKAESEETSYEELLDEYEASLLN